MLATNYLRAWIALLLAVGTAVSSQEKPASPPMVPGEVIVKFTTKSQGAELVARAAAKGALPDAELNKHVQSLAKKVEIPLAVKQLGSGGNVILTVEQTDLLVTLAQKLKARPNVEQANVTPLGGETVQAIEVRFVPGSLEANALAQIRISGYDLRSIIVPLERDYSLKLNGQISNAGFLLLKLDLNALTIDLSRRLAEQPDVEYAQPNFVRRIIGRTKS